MKNLDDMTRKEAKAILDQGGIFTLPGESIHTTIHRHLPSSASEGDVGGFQAGAIPWAEGYYAVLPSGEAPFGMPGPFNQIAASYEELTANMTRLGPFEQWEVVEQT